MEIKVKAPAKINLTLEVLGKRPDGYHNIATVMQAVDLHDVITLTDNDSGRVTISCNYEGVPCDDSNICAKAAYRFFDYCKMDVRGVHIDIDKRIPAQAGLAGGSADCAGGARDGAGAHLDEVGRAVCARGECAQRGPDGEPRAFPWRLGGRRL